jgi:Ubiquitin fusion degradation protein 2
MELMDDPVVATDGHSYQRVAIEAWLHMHSTSPVTNNPLESKRLTPNFALRSPVLGWQDEQRRAGRGA